MCKADIYKILEYESFKYNFFINKNISDSVREEFSSYEEKTYGRELCKIYEDLYSINYGKKYIRELITVILLYIMSVLFNEINMIQFFRTQDFIIDMINIAVGVFLLIRVLKIKSYYNFLLYKLVKIKKK